jgi:integrase
LLLRRPVAYPAQGHSDQHLLIDNAGAPWQRPPTEDLLLLRQALNNLDRRESDALSDTSSGCRPRKSPLASKGAFALLRDERKRKGLPTKLDGRDRTSLPAGRAERPYTTRGLHRLVAKAAKLASIDKPVSPHWLRHSFATLAAVGGAPPYQLQADLGHARLETSQRYVHWAKGLADSAVDWLPIRHLTVGERDSKCPSPAHITS